MGNAASYRKRRAAVEAEIDGDIWVVEPMTKVDHAKYFNGIILLQDGSGRTSPQEMEESEQANKQIYEDKVRGIKDPQSGIVEPVP